MTPQAQLLTQAGEAERDYPVKVSVRFGYLCARIPGVSGAHWDADDGAGLLRQLAAARVPRRKPPPGADPRAPGGLPAGW